MYCIVVNILNNLYYDIIIILMKIFKFKLNFLSTFLLFCIICIGTKKYVFKYLHSLLMATIQIMLLFF